MPRSQLSNRGRTSEQKQQLRVGRQQAVKSFKEANPDLSGRQIAERLGLNPRTVAKDLRAIGYYNPPLTPQQINARDERVREFIHLNPKLTQPRVAKAMELSLYAVQKVWDKPMKGKADQRMEETYAQLTKNYVCTASLLAKHAATSTVTARRWLRTHHPAGLINFKRVKVTIATYQRTYNGKVVTVRAFDRKFPALIPAR